MLDASTNCKQRSDCSCRHSLIRIYCLCKGWSSFPKISLPYPETTTKIFLWYPETILASNKRVLKIYRENSSSTVKFYLPFLLVVSVLTRSSRFTRFELAPRNSCGVFLCFCFSAGKAELIPSKFQGSGFGSSVETFIVDS